MGRGDSEFESQYPDQSKLNDFSGRDDCSLAPPAAGLASQKTFCLATKCRQTLMDMQNSQSNTLAKAGLMVGVSLVLGLLFDYFFYGKIPGIAFPLYVILVVAGLFAIANFFKKQISKEVFWLLAPLIFFSAMVFVRSSGLLMFLNVVASLLLLLLIT